MTHGGSRDAPTGPPTPNDKACSQVLRERGGNVSHVFCGGWGSASTAWKKKLRDAVKQSSTEKCRVGEAAAWSLQAATRVLRGLYEGWPPARPPETLASRGRRGLFPQRPTEARALALQLLLS